MTLISRKDAIAQGLTHYYTGKMCKHGHICQRYISGLCVDCATYSTRSAEDKAKRKAANTNWCRSAKGKALIANVHLLRKYGLSVEDRRAIIDQQNGKCKICANLLEIGEDNSYMKAVIDHCHATGKIRGVLCSACNKMLGFAKDDPAVLQRAIEYLQSNS